MLHPLQDYAANCPEERRNGETQRSSCSGWPLVRTKLSAAVEDERKVLCESLNSSASNSQYSLTSLPLSASPPQPCLMAPVQPNARVRAASNVHSCFHPCMFPSDLLAHCLFLLSNTNSCEPSALCSFYGIKAFNTAVFLKDYKYVYM